MVYELLKIAHIVSVISWMVGLLYLPRLMVYHSVSSGGSEQSETFKIMERRLLKGIMTPAMLLSWVFGLGLAGSLDAWFQGWFIVKLLMIVLLTVFHVYLAGLVREFSSDSSSRPQRFFRLINEVPTVIMIIVIALVILKPF